MLPKKPNLISTITDFFKPLDSSKPPPKVTGAQGGPAHRAWFIGEGGPNVDNTSTERGGAGGGGGGGGGGAGSSSTTASTSSVARWGTPRVRKLKSVNTTPQNLETFLELNKGVFPATNIFDQTSDDDVNLHRTAFAESFPRVVRVQTSVTFASTSFPGLVDLLKDRSMDLSRIQDESKDVWVRRCDLALHAGELPSLATLSRMQPVAIEGTSFGSYIILGVGGQEDGRNKEANGEAVDYAGKGASVPVVVDGRELAGIETRVNRVHKNQHGRSVGRRAHIHTAAFGDPEMARPESVATPSDAVIVFYSTVLEEPRDGCTEGDKALYITATEPVEIDMRGQSNGITFDAFCCRNPDFQRRRHLGHAANRHPGGNADVKGWSLKKATDMLDKISSASSAASSTGGLVTAAIRREETRYRLFDGTQPFSVIAGSGNVLYFQVTKVLAARKDAVLSAFGRDPFFPECAHGQPKQGRAPTRSAGVVWIRLLPVEGMLMRFTFDEVHL